MKACVKHIHRYLMSIRLSVGEYSAKFGNTSPMHRHTHCCGKINCFCSAMHPCLIAGSTANNGVHTLLLFCGRFIRQMFRLYRAMSTDASAIMDWRDYKTKRKFISASRKFSMQILKILALFLGTHDGWRCKRNRPTPDHR